MTVASTWTADSPFTRRTQITTAGVTQLETQDFDQVTAAAIPSGVVYSASCDFATVIVSLPTVGVSVDPHVKERRVPVPMTVLDGWGE